LFIAARRGCDAAGTRRGLAGAVHAADGVEGDGQADGDGVRERLVRVWRVQARHICDDQPLDLDGAQPAKVGEVRSKLEPGLPVPEHEAFELQLSLRSALGCERPR
jgi:hypothetical protein